jgi:hypothetical protein
VAILSFKISPKIDILKQLWFFSDSLALEPLYFSAVGKTKVVLVYMQNQYVSIWH